MFCCALVVVLCLASVAQGQETHSVLVNPPVVVPGVPEVLPEVAPPVIVPVVPRQIIVLKKGLFGWRAKLMTLQPLPVVVATPAPRPVVIWTPQVIWR